MAHRWHEKHTNALFGLAEDARGPVEMFERLGLIGPSSIPEIFLAAPIGGPPSIREGGTDYASPSPRTMSPHHSTSAASVDGFTAPPRRRQYTTLDEIVAAVPANDSNSNSGWPLGGEEVVASPVPANNEHYSARPVVPIAAGETSADRVRRELSKRNVQQAYVNHLIAALSPPPDGRSRVAAVVDLSASALRTHSYPYSQSLPNTSDPEEAGSWYSQQHPLLGLSGAAQVVSSSHPRSGGELFIRKGPLGRSSRPSARRLSGASGREAHYHTELQLFYEALLEVELDDSLLPSGATKQPSTHLTPEEYTIRRSVLEERCNNIPMLLAKFHGYEEDLFKMLKAKYNAPAYRFMHST